MHPVQLIRSKILALILVLWTNGWYAQSPQFRHYTVSEGLANSTVYFSMQDSKGYVWFCTESGVSRFDGRRFETFTTRDGLADNENFKCYEDSHGRIWFMSYNGRLSYYKDTCFINENKDPALKYETKQGAYIIDMLEGEQGQLWFSTFLRSVQCYDGHRITKGKNFEKRAEVYNHMLFNHHGSVHIMMYDDSVHSIDVANGVKIPLGKNASGAGTGFISKQHFGQDSIYFLSTDGLNVLWKDTTYLVMSNAMLGSVFGNFSIVNGNLWVSTKLGLILIPDFMTRGYTGNKKIFLPGIAIASITFDHEGGLWIATMADGVYYLPASQSYITSMPGISVTSVSREESSDLWAAGTYYGDLMIWKKDALIRHYHFNQENTRVKSIKWLSKNSILLGTDHAPYLYDLAKDRIQPLIVDAKGISLPTGFCDISESTAGLWIAGRCTIWLWDYRHAPRLAFGPGEALGLCNYRIVSVAGAGRSGCWFTSIQELHWLDAATGRTTYIAGPELFKSNLRDLIYVKGYLWVATDGNGIFIFKDRRLYRHISSNNAKIANKACQKLVYDGKDHIWVATNKGISVYNVFTYKQVMSLSSNDVLLNNDTKDISLHNNKAFIATPSGISIIDMNNFVDTTAPPKVYIRYLSARDKTYNNLVSPVFSYYNGVVTVAFAAITFQANPALMYRYKIRGENETWNETGTDRVEFYDLAPGIYTLLLSARKYNSGWSQPVGYTFTVLPSWYQAWWFKVLLALMALSFVYLWIRRIRKREQEKTSFNQKIAELKNSALASQMNPHFIFNAINSIQDFIFRNDELAANEYLSKFAKLMRLFLESSRQAFTSVKDETELLKLYTEMEKLRFEEKINFTIHIDSGLDDATEIPTMMIQPFVENAINHGLVYKNGTGNLLIEFIASGQGVICVVDDDGIGIEQSLTMKRDGHISRGMEMIDQRMTVYASLETESLFTYRIFDKMDAHGKVAGTRVELLFNV